MTRGRALLAIRVVSGVVFVVFGFGKFVNDSSELASFQSYGLPLPGLFIVAIGVIEILGGGLLIRGRLLEPTALALAGDMVGAIVVSGLARGEIISLTLAPVLLVAMIVVLWAERRPAMLSGRPGLR